MKDEDDDKEFPSKRCWIIIGAIITAIAFIETTGAVWSWTFWREFLLNLIIYSIVSAIAILILNSFLGWLD